MYNYMRKCNAESQKRSALKEAESVLLVYLLVYGCMRPIYLVCGDGVAHVEFGPEFLHGHGNGILGDAHFKRSQLVPFLRI